MNNFNTYTLCCMLLWIGGLCYAQTQKINAYEYWLDRDYSTVQSVTVAATATLNIDEQIDISGLDYGIHTVSYRFQDERGVWSVPKMKIFGYYADITAPIELKKINAYEYWLDSDYSTVQRTTIGAVATLTLDEQIDISGVDYGFHKISYRFKDTRGSWSNTKTKFFAYYPNSQGAGELKEITAYQYWIDTDIENVQTVDVANTASLNIDEQIDLTSVDYGFHKISYRFKDTRGLWGNPKTKFFAYYAPEVVSATEPFKITAYRYWVNQDYSTVVTNTIDPATANYSLDEIISIPQDLHKGNHTITHQFQDETGKWSVPKISKFFKPYAVSIDPNPACRGAEVQFEIEEDADYYHYSWSFGDGTYDSSSSNNISHSFTKAGTLEMEIKMYLLVTQPDGTLSPMLAFTQKVPIEIKPSYPDVPLAAENLVAYYPFYGDAQDLSVNENHGVVKGAAARVDDRNGLAYSAYEFDGNNDYISLSDETNNVSSASLNLPSDVITISTWVKPTEFREWAATVGFIQDNGSNEFGFILGTMSNSKFYFGLAGEEGSSGLTYMQTEESYATDQWYLLTATYDGTTMKLYVNGELSSSSTQQSGAISYTDSKLCIGKYQDDNEAYYFKGTIDEVRIYNKALTDEEVEAIYNNITEIKEVCDVDLPYTFGAQQLSEGGNYFENFSTETACDNMVGLKLKVKSCECTKDPTLASGDNQPGVTNLGISTLDRGTEDWLPQNLGAFMVLESKTKGFTITRNADPENNIQQPVEGMLVWDTSSDCLRLYRKNSETQAMEWKCVKKKCNE